MTIALTLLVVSVVLLAATAIWLARTMKWIDERTTEDRFFRLPLAERTPVTHFEGTKVPGVCTTETMQYAKDYKPEPVDVFVATQMKCGTTWMQQIVQPGLNHGARYCWKTHPLSMVAE